MMKFNVFAQGPLDIAKRLLSNTFRPAHGVYNWPPIHDVSVAADKIAEKIAEAAVAEVMMRLRTAGLYWCPQCETFIKVDESKGERRVCGGCLGSLDGAPY